MGPFAAHPVPEHLRAVVQAPSSVRRTRLRLTMRHSVPVGPRPSADMARRHESFPTLLPRSVLGPRATHGPPRWPESLCSFADYCEWRPTPSGGYGHTIEGTNDGVEMGPPRPASGASAAGESRNRPPRNWPRPRYVCATWRARFFWVRGSAGAVLAVARLPEITMLLEGLMRRTGNSIKVAFAIPYSKFLATVLSEKQFINMAQKHFFLATTSHSVSIQSNYFNLRGPAYYDILSAFHDFHFGRNPRYSYLEIGTSDYRSLLIAKGAVNVGVDPLPRGAFRVNANETAEFRLNVASSDVFFRIYEDSKRMYDLIFIDGLHAFEQVTKDLVNSISKSSHVDTDILVHDVIPISRFVADPDRRTKLWAGDVYKLTYLLQGLNVSFQIILTPPTGLLWIKGNQKDQVFKYVLGSDRLRFDIEDINKKHPVEAFNTVAFYDEFSDYMMSSAEALEALSSSAW